MKINLRYLRQGESTVVVQLKKTEVEILKEDTTCEVKLLRMGSRIRATSEFKAKIIMECARCLENFVKEVNLKVDCTFVPANEFVPHGATELFLTSKEADTLPYFGEEIDITEMLRDTVMLAVPIKPLCKPDCKGLCQICGKNLNKGLCKHVKEK